MLHASSLTEDCPPCILNETEIPLEKIKNNMVFNLMISMDVQKATQNSDSPFVWVLHDFAILHDLLSLLTQFYVCEIYVITGFVTKNNGHLMLSDLINYQPIICILFFTKITAVPVAKKIPKDLLISELAPWSFSVSLFAWVWDRNCTGSINLRMNYDCMSMVILLDFSFKFHWLSYYTTVMNTAFELLFSLLICFSQNVLCEIHFLPLKALWWGTTLEICLVIFPVQCVFETAGWVGVIGSKYCF